MKSKTMEKHRANSPSKLSCGVITLSDSKYEDSKKGKNTDKSGKLIIKTIEEKYSLDSYCIIPDDAKKLLSAIEKMVDKKIDVIFTTGGTGIGSRDITVETISLIFEKELTGFGEIFRAETYKELGSGAILSRATAGVYKKTLIFAMPGSPNAVKLGLSIVVDELNHLVKHLKE
jgi:molybdenum cofactor biosynthesis protein B